MTVVTMTDVKEDDWRSRLTSVASIRDEIDQIDTALVELLKRRMVCSVEMGDAKRRELPDAADIVFRPGREAVVLAKLIKAGQGVPQSLIYRVWREIFSASCQVQQAFQIGTLASTREAALLHFGEMGVLRAFDTPEQSLEALAAGKLDMAVLPFDLSQGWGAKLNALELHISASVQALQPKGGLPTEVVVTRHAADEPKSLEGLSFTSLFITSNGFGVEQGFTSEGRADLAGHLIQVISE